MTGSANSYEYPMISVYAPYDNKLCPDECGFVVTDFVTKHIFACTGYCNFFEGYLEMDYLRPEVEMGPLFPWQKNSPWREMEQANADKRARDYQRVRSFFNEGHLNKFRTRLHEDILVKPSDFASFQAFVGGVMLHEKGSIGLTRVGYEPPNGWKCLQYSDYSAKERREAVARVRMLGVVSSEDEERYVDNFYSDEDSDDDDDD